jgi:hypothetical protein
MVYDSGTAGKALRPTPRTMTLAQVRQLQAAEKAAKDAFWATGGAAGSKMTAKQSKLQAAMIAATKARQAAMTAYAATL